MVLRKGPEARHIFILASQPMRVQNLAGQSEIGEEGDQRPGKRVAARLDFNLAGVLPENPGSLRPGEPFAG